MVDSTFTVEAAAISGAMAYSYGDTINLVVTDTTDINTIAWSIVGSSDSSLSTPAFTNSGSPSGAISEFDLPADPGGGKGVSFGVKCLVTDSNGDTDATIATVGVLNEAGVCPAFSGEKLERDATHGWTEIVNAALADNVSQAVEVDTTDATATTVLSHPLADDTITFGQCRVVTYETSGAPGTDTLTREWTWQYQRQDAGAPTKIAVDSDGGVYSHQDDGTWTATVDVSSNTMRIRVTNDATNNCTSRAQLWVTEMAIA